MCELCNKIEFAIETLEALFNEDELKDFYWSHIGDQLGEKTGIKNKDEFWENPSNLASLHANFICQVWAKYCLKHKIHPGSALDIAEAHARAIYEKFLAEQNGMIEKSPVEILLEKLRGYDS